MPALLGVDPGVVSSESLKSFRGAAGQEDKQACRFKFINTVLPFMSITGWLRSGSFQRTLVLS